MCAAPLLGIGPDGALQGEGRIGAPGIIFVGNRHPEEGYNAIAKHLVDGALIAVHGIHHMMDDRVQQWLGGFRIKALDESGGVFDVGEEDGDLLAFACEGAFGSQNLLGQMLNSSLLPAASQKGEETTSDGSFELAYDVPRSVGALSRASSSGPICTCSGKVASPG